MIPALLSKVEYSGEHGAAKWRGCKVADEKGFESYLKDRVKARVEDADAHGPFAAEMRSFATTGMETTFVENLLRAVPEDKSWAIGEALAECILADDEARQICWPWNLVRDRRAPRASLPGADLVGFCKEGDKVFLLIGEIKTSSDKNVPPKVMNGSGGMAWQLEKDATCLEIQHTLLRWLRARCNTSELEGLYQAAAKRYAQSCGKEILLVGVLLRDTEPHEADVTNRAKALANILDSPTRIEIMAWYLPIPIKSWPSLLREENPL